MSEVFDIPLIAKLDQCEETCNGDVYNDDGQLITPCDGFHHVSIEVGADYDNLRDLDVIIPNLDDDSISISYHDKDGVIMSDYHVDVMIHERTLRHLLQLVFQYKMGINENVFLTSLRYDPQAKYLDTLWEIDNSEIASPLYVAF